MSHKSRAPKTPRRPRTPRSPRWDLQLDSISGAGSQSDLSCPVGPLSKVKPFETIALVHFEKLQAVNAEVLARVTAIEKITRRGRTVDCPGASNSAHEAPIKLAEENGIFATVENGKTNGHANELYDMPMPANFEVKREFTPTLERKGSKASDLGSHASSQRSSSLCDMEHVAAVFAKHAMISGSRSKWKTAIWQFLENRSSSTWAYWYSYFAPIFVLTSVIFSCVQTVEEFSLDQHLFSNIQIGFEVSFLMEISVRFWVAPNRIEFFCSFFNQLDLLSCAPLLFRPVAGFAAPEVATHKALSLFANVRVFKLLRRFHKFKLLVTAFSLALEALPVLLFTMCLVAVLFSSLIYLVEGQDHITSLPHSFWFIIVTMTTVGYGDITPNTVAGECITLVLMVVSALYMAMPIGIVGSAFSEVWSDRDRLLLLAVLRDNFALSGVSLGLVEDMFKVFISNTGGDEPEELELGLPEFRRMMAALKVGIAGDRLDALFNAIDVDGGGSITCDEFIQTIFPTAYYLHKRGSLGKSPTHETLGTSESGQVSPSWSPMLRGTMSSLSSSLDSAMVSVTGSLGKSNSSCEHDDQKRNAFREVPIGL